MNSHLSRSVLISVFIASFAMSIPFAVLAGIYGRQEYSEKWICTVEVFQFSEGKDPWILDFVWRVSAVRMLDNYTIDDASIKQTVNKHSATYDLPYMLDLHPISSSARCIQKDPSSSTNPNTFEWKKASFAGFVSMLTLASFFGTTCLVSLFLLLLFFTWGSFKKQRPTS